jgi:predicted alpha/beta hydrolase
MSANLEPVRRRTLMISAVDGYPLAATLFEPPSPGAKAPVTIIAGATGVPQSFYARFATYLAENGRIALTFDYRGIGGSITGHAKHSTVRYRDWGILDTPAMLGWAHRTFPQHPIHWVGQSYGGFATGLAHNNHLVGRQLGVSTMSADYRYVTSRFERAKIAGLLFVAGPVVARTLGYMPGWVNGGADLPKDVLLEWSRWVRARGFLFGTDDLPEKRHFAGLKAPLCFAFMEDDAWIARAGVDDLASRYENASSCAFWPITLVESGADRIGHIGFFRSDFRSTLWPKALNWLNGGDFTKRGTNERNDD